MFRFLLGDGRWQELCCCARHTTSSLIFEMCRTLGEPKMANRLWSAPCLLNASPRVCILRTKSG